MPTKMVCLFRNLKKWLQLFRISIVSHTSFFTAADAGYSLAFGPGVEEIISYDPTSYTIQAYNSQGNKIHHGGEPFDAEVIGPDGSPIRTKVCLCCEWKGEKRWKNREDSKEKKGKKKKNFFLLFISFPSFPSFPCILFPFKHVLNSCPPHLSLHLQVG